MLGISNDKIADNHIAHLPPRSSRPCRQALAGPRRMPLGVESTINDGDSFRVHWNGGEVTIRLYFTDTPESDYRFMDRTRDQAAYFGISEEQAVEAGKLAKDFTRDALKDGFEIRTRWQGVFSGKPNARKYGIVSVGGKDLAELLVANGLARIHGMGIGGKTWEEVERLKALEAQAKAEKRGAWGMAKS